MKISKPALNMLLFIHRVEGLEKGLYFFFRYEKEKNRFISQTRKEFLWEKVSDEIELYLLYRGDVEDTARIVSCHQDIASDSSFSLGMIANLEEMYEKPWLYKNIHWEAGLTGQILYLEAEAHSIRGTGIGCFFDDGVHEILGLKNKEFQDVYHFTIGGYLEDIRLTTRPPYYHLGYY